MTPDPGLANADTEAVIWLIALREEPDDAALRARFETWLAADEAHRTAWAEAAGVYERIGQTAPVHRTYWDLPRSGALLAGLRPHMASGKARAAAFAIWLILIALPHMQPQVLADYRTATAEMRAITLGDGSIVHLGPDSAIDVAFKSGQRRVRLLGGEAYFEVARDVSRPFTVEAGSVESTVLGTAFNVRAGDGGTTVSVAHGLVGVPYPKAQEPVQLGAGDWLSYSRDGNTARGAGRADQTAAWRQGQIIAQDRAVADVVAELRRSFGGVILITSDALAERRVTGIYRASDPLEALRAIAEAHGVVVRQVLPGVLLLSAR